MFSTFLFIGRGNVDVSVIKLCLLNCNSYKSDKVDVMTVADAISHPPEGLHKPPIKRTVVCVVFMNVRIASITNGTSHSLSASISQQKK